MLDPYFALASLGVLFLAWALARSTAMRERAAKRATRSCGFPTGEPTRRYLEELRAVSPSALPAFPEEARRPVAPLPLECALEDAADGDGEALETLSRAAIRHTSDGAPPSGGILDAAPARLFGEGLGCSLGAGLLGGERRAAPPVYLDPDGVPVLDCTTPVRPLPDCMMPDGADPCAGYQDLAERFGPVLEVDAPSFLPDYHLAQVGRKGSLAVAPDRFPPDVARHVFLLGLERALADACAGSDSLEPARWLLSQWYSGRLAKPGEARWRREGV